MQVIVNHSNLSPQPIILTHFACVSSLHDLKYFSFVYLHSLMLYSQEQGGWVSEWVLFVNRLKKISNLIIATAINVGRISSPYCACG